MNPLVIVLAFVGIPLFVTVMMVDYVLKVIGAPRFKWCRLVDSLEGFCGLAAAIGLSFYCGIAITIISVIVFIVCEFKNEI